MVEYRKVAFTHRGVRFGILLEPPQGSSALVAIHNCMRFLEGSVEFVECTVDEREVRKTIGAALKGILDASSLKDEAKQDVLNVLHDISPEFRVSPLLSAPRDFELGGAYFLFRCLGIELMHGWLVSPEVSIYESIKGCTKAKLKSAKLKAVGDQDRKVIKGLLYDSRLQLTAYGFRCLAANVDDEDFVLLFWDNRFDILFKTYGELFVLVTDEGRRQKMPEVTWMLFEHSQQQNIYLKEDFSPVTGQPFEKRAGEWHKGFLEKITEAKIYEAEVQAVAEEWDAIFAKCFGESNEWDAIFAKSFGESNELAAREATEELAAAALATEEQRGWMKSYREAVKLMDSLRELEKSYKNLNLDGEDGGGSVAE